MERNFRKYLRMFSQNFYSYLKFKVIYDNFSKTQKIHDFQKKFKTSKKKREVI